jgi:two-component system sensor kinase FixL
MLFTFSGFRPLLRGDAFMTPVLSSHRRTISGSSPSKLVSFGVAITLLLFGLVIWELLTAYRSYTIIQNDELALDNLEVSLTRLDGELSVAALQYVSSGDPVWEVRYDADASGLDSVITDAATALDTTQSEAELTQIRKAHAERMGTERDAMRLAQQGNHSGAIELLASDAYRDLKHAYVQSIDSALQRLNDREELNSVLLREKLRLIAIFTGGVVAVAWLSILGAMQVNFRRRRRAELVLRDSEARYRAVLQAAFDDILLTENGMILEVSDKFAQMLGYDRSEIIGKPVVELVAPEEREFVRLAQASGYDRPYETMCLRKDNTRFPLEVCGRMVPYQGRQARITAVRDISERKHAEAEREALIRDLKQKNDELERFSYTVSHDLKSPLITIKGFLKWIERDAHSGNVERLQTNIERIASAADKMERFMNSILELSRNGHGPRKHEPILFEDLAHEAAELVTGRIAQRGVDVRVEENLPLVYGDRARLLEVLMNLVDNAVKFMGDQTTPVIEIGVRHPERDPVFYVQDNGIGIAPADQEQILGLFEKLNPDAEGSGVGLALVKRIIEQHGGTLWVESEGLGHGTTFCFRLADVAVGQAA